MTVPAVGCWEDTDCCNRRHMKRIHYFAPIAYCPSSSAVGHSHRGHRWQSPHVAHWVVVVLLAAAARQRQ